MLRLSAFSPALVAHCAILFFAKNVREQTIPNGEKSFLFYLNFSSRQSTERFFSLAEMEKGLETLGVCPYGSVHVLA